MTQSACANPTYDTIGYVGGAVLASALLPQVYKTATTRSCSDMSFWWLCVYISGLILLLTYSIGIRALPIMIPICIEMTLAISLFVMKIFFDLIPSWRSSRLEIQIPSTQYPALSLESDRRLDSAFMQFMAHTNGADLPTPGPGRGAKAPPSAQAGAGGQGTAPGPGASSSAARGSLESPRAPLNPPAAAPAPEI
eukprot:tig00000955_g5790.t1